MFGDTVLEQAEKAASGQKVIGYVVWWGLDGVHVDGIAAAADWSCAGLPEEFEPKALKAATAYSAAIKRALVKQGDAATRISVKEVAKTEGYWLHSIKEWESVSNDEGMAADVEPTTVSKVALTFEDELVVVSESHPIADNIQRLFEHHNGYCGANEVRPSVTNTIRQLGGVPLRHNGGIYFVPRGSSETLQALKKVVEGWGSSTFYPLPQVDGDEARRAVTASARDAFREELATVRAEVEEFIAREDDPDAPTLRDSTVQRRLDQLQEMRDRAELYVEAIELNRDVLLEGADEVEQMTRQLLAAIS